MTNVDLQKINAVVAPEARAGDARAEAFQGVRVAKRNELAEDYVELIARLIYNQGEARPVDIATKMGVTAPTVAKTLDRLAGGRGYYPRRVFLRFFDGGRPRTGQGMPPPA